MRHDLSRPRTVLNVTGDRHDVYHQRSGLETLEREFRKADRLQPANVFMMSLKRACGVLDISRHRKITYEMIEKYFMGNGIPTWFLSPINPMDDLFSYWNKGQYALADLPEGHRAEIEACVRALVDNGDSLKAHIGKTIGANKRAMLTFKWYDAAQATEFKIPAFEKEYRYIKTIAVSVFNTRERTSRHFGPLPLTFRVLYNLEPIDSRDVYIEVDDKVHYWKDNPLFIFDDTMFHRSINDVDHIRYCLFMDIVRPNHAQGLFKFGSNSEHDRQLVQASLLQKLVVCPLIVKIQRAEKSAIGRSLHRAPPF